MDLDTWINEPEPDLDDAENQMENGSLEIFYKTTAAPVQDYRESYQGESGTNFVAAGDKEDDHQRRETRRIEQSTNPHYLKSSSYSRQSPSSQLISQSDDIPVTPISLTVPLQISTSKKLSDKYLELEKSKDNSSVSKKARSKKDRKKKNKSEKEGMLRGSSKTFYYNYF